MSNIILSIGKGLLIIITLGVGGWALREIIKERMWALLAFILAVSIALGLIGLGLYLQTIGV